MSDSMFHPENNIVVELIAGTVGGAVKNGLNVNLKNVQRAFIYCFNNKGVDATQCTWTLAQSTGGGGSATGTGEKALTNNVPIYFTDTAQLSNVVASTTAAKAYQQSAEQSRTQMVVFDIVPEACMDLAGGFNHIVVNTTDPGAANSIHAIAILVPRYAPLPDVLA